MKTLCTILPKLEIAYPLESIAEPNKIAFLDIETTGFFAKSSSIYMIGCIVKNGEQLVCHQWFSEKEEEEKELLEFFLIFIKNYNFLIHFNGNNFDIPFLNEKLREYNFENPLKSMGGLDLYRRINPYKNFLKLPNCKQKTLETYLGVDRQDTLSGKELIGVYEHYKLVPNDNEMGLLLLHNREDIFGMVQLLPILSYPHLVNDKICVTKVQANYYTDFQQNTRQEIVMKCKLPVSLPIQVSNYSHGCFFTGIGTDATIKVPLIHDELKYFYANYKDYYYLPEEDIALHKSVSAYVDKDHRKQATAATCYTRKESDYLPRWNLSWDSLWEPLFSPIFRKDYESKDMYFELTPEMKQNRELFSEYASHILGIIIGLKES